MSPRLPSPSGSIPPSANDAISPRLPRSIPSSLPVSAQICRERRRFDGASGMNASPCVSCSAHWISPSGPCARSIFALLGSGVARPPFANDCTPCVPPSANEKMPPSAAPGSEGRPVTGTVNDILLSAAWIEPSDPAASCGVIVAVRGRAVLSRSAFARADSDNNCSISSRACGSTTRECSASNSECEMSRPCMNWSINRSTSGSGRCMSNSASSRKISPIRLFAAAVSALIIGVAVFWSTWSIAGNKSINALPTSPAFVLTSTFGDSRPTFADSSTTP